MTWTDILEIMRLLKAWDRRGALVTWQGETRLYYAREWGEVAYSALLDNAALLNLDDLPALDILEAQP